MRTGQNCGTIVLQNGSFLVLSLGLIVLTHTHMLMVHTIHLW